MAFPVVSFPACFLLALSELLVPELTEAQVAGREAYIARTTSRLMERCLIFSLGIAAILFTFSHELGLVIFSSASAGYYIRLFALLSPVMYMDMVTDGCLKGLGMMMYSMVVNILDSVGCVLLVLILLPKYGLHGYILMIFISELFNFVLSILRLHSRVHLRLEIGRILLALFCAVGAAQSVHFYLIQGHFSPTLFRLCLALLYASAGYILLLWLSGCLHISVPFIPSLDRGRHGFDGQK